MSFKVCLIDDDLLEVNRSGKMLFECEIATKLLQMYPKEDDENYESKKNLCDFIDSIIKENELTLFGYTNPKLYNDNIGHDSAFDVVIYDWEYGATAGAIDPANELNKLIDNSHCYVCIYSHMDDEVHKKLINFIKDKNRHRVDFLIKGEVNSAETLKSKIQKYTQNSFSAQFAKELRANASRSVEKILVKLAHVGTEKFHQMMGTNNEEKKKELVEFIAEKFKNNMMEMDFLTNETAEVLPVESNDEMMYPAVGAVQEPSIKELWHYRMYSTMRDKRVRKGDIYKKNDNEYIMIMTPNCQLIKYHENKTFGILNYCKLIKTDILEETVKRLVLHEGDASARNTCVGKPGSMKTVYSLINQIGSKESAPFILPYVKPDEANLILFPKMYTFMEIQVKNQDKYLEQNELIGYEYVTSLNEPFLSELIKEIYDKLERNGVPNFSKQVQDEINSILLASFTRQ